MHRLLPVLFFVALIVSFFSYTPFRREIVYTLGISGDKTESCCNVEDILSSTGDFDENSKLAFFNNELIDYPKNSLAQIDYLPQNSQVLGTTNTSGEEKWIEVSLNQQKVRAWEGNTIVMEFSISSGKWAKTPTGTFHIWYKTKRQKMEGGSKALGTYYYLPNVPHNMFFYKGFALHGAYWHNNFGQPMSHGCVNEPLANAAQIFDWAGPVLSEGKNAVRADATNPGTKVFIH